MTSYKCQGSTISNISFKIDKKELPLEIPNLMYTLCSRVKFIDNIYITDIDEKYLMKYINNNLFKNKLIEFKNNNYDEISKLDVSYIKSKKELMIEVLLLMLRNW